MNLLDNTLIFLGAFLAVFWEAAFDGVRRLTGAQIDLLPALMVYASLRSSFTTVAVLSLAGGLWLDALSANPLGVTVVPLFIIGLMIYSNRELILRDNFTAQFVIGFAASAAVPLMVVLLLLTTGKDPLLGWGSLWQWSVMSIGGAVATPIWFELFKFFNRVFGVHHVSESSFRPDREIQRGK